MEKDFKDVSLNITEPEYRNDNALSYSTLAKFEREGFNNLSKLKEKVESPSLTFGSAVDSIITGGMEEFNDRFIVEDFPSIGDSVIKMVKVLFDNYSEEFKKLYDIPNDYIIAMSNILSYQLNWKPETRARVIKEQGSIYYNILYKAKGKSVLSVQTYNSVMSAVHALKESPATKFYFQEDNPFDNIKRYYQLKFKATFDGISYRNMADLIIVDYNKKEVTPIDLKTSSHTEWDFYQSFVDWLYMIQARLYWRIIRDTMDKDDYFKDFKLNDYKFIVVNKNGLTPLVWDYPDTQKTGTLYYGKNNQIVCRDPFEIGKELYGYLHSNPRVPNGININESNNLIEWLKKL